MRTYWIMVEAEGDESEDEAGDIESAICDVLNRSVKTVAVCTTDEELHALLAARR